jgi:hypothetical protein
MTDEIEVTEAPRPTWDLMTLHQNPEALARFDLAIDAGILALAAGPEPSPDALAWARLVIEHPGNRPKIALRAAMLARAYPSFAEAHANEVPLADIPMSEWVDVLFILVAVRGSEPIPPDAPPVGVGR